jgi:hypothetical protein
VELKVKSSLDSVLLFTMAEPSIGKQEGEITAVQHSSIDDGRRTSLNDVDLNKNLDAK